METDNLFHKRRKPKDLFIVGGLVFLLVAFVALALAVIFLDDTAIYLQQLLGLSEEPNGELRKKYDVLKVIGFCIVGVLLVWQAWAANKRAKAMEDATENTEAGQRQERLKNAIEHLGHKRDSVRMGGAYELFHLAKDTEVWRQTVLDILCAHIRHMTGGEDYQKEHKIKPSEEIQSLLALLFVQDHDVFQGCSINLQGSYLNGTTLNQARLKDANLRGVQLQKADLREAHLEKADLREARLEGSVLREAWLQEADFFRAQLQEAQLQKADLWEAQLQGAKIWQAQLQGANLMAARLQGADLWEAQLQEAKLWLAQLQGVDLSEAQLQGANFWQAQLQGTDLSNAQLQGATLEHTRLQGTDLSNAQLQGANLFEVQLQGANLLDMQLQGVSSQEVLSLLSVKFESKIRNRIGKHSELTGIIFAGGLQEEDLDTLCKGLSDEKAQALRETLGPHIGRPVSRELPKDSGAVIVPPSPPYTQEEAERWIAEYNKAMEGVPRTDDTADADSAPDSDKDKGN